MSTHLIVNSQIHCNLFKVSPASCSTTTRRYRTRICGIVNAHPTLYAWCFVLLFTSNLDIISLSFISALHFQVKYNNKDKVIFHFVFFFFFFRPVPFLSDSITTHSVIGMVVSTMLLHALHHAYLVFVHSVHPYHNHRIQKKWGEPLHTIWDFTYSVETR